MIVNIAPDDSSEISDRQILSHLEVWFDGVRQLTALKADEKRGLVRRFKIDSRGLIDYDDDDKPITEVVEGKVEIRVAETAPEQIKAFIRELRAMEAGA